MEMVPEEQAVALLEEFVDSYLERGLGGYSGRELELLVLELCMNLHPEFKEMTVFEKSRLLKASETKIKNMLYQIKLRRKDNPQDLIAQFERSLDSMEIDGGRVIIEMDDIYSKKKLKAMLKDCGALSDSSFNSDLMKIPVGAFILVVTKLYPEKAKQKHYQDLLEVKRFSESFDDLIDGLKVPGTDLKAKSLWEFACNTADVILSKFDLDSAGLAGDQAQAANPPRKPAQEIPALRQ